MSTWPRPERRLLALVLALATLLLPGPAHAGLQEKWYLMRAKQNMDIKNYAAAIEAYRKVLEDTPHHAEALKGLAQAHDASGQTDEAIAAWDRYLERNPRDHAAALRQARTLSWDRYAYRRKDAIRYYRAGLEGRDEPEARLALARLLAQDKERLDDALKEYRTVLQQRPQDAALRAEYRKLLLWDPRHRDEAAKEYERMLAERPGDGATRRQLAQLLAEDAGRRDESIEHYARLVEKSPRDRSLRLEYARVLARDRRTAEARAQMEAGMGGKPDRATRVLYADLLAADADSEDEALEAYGRLVEENPKDTDTRLKYARLLGGRKETNAKAIGHYQQALAQRPSSGEAHAGLARAYAWEGESDRALHHQRLARERGFNTADLRELREDLSEGREPRVGGGVEVIVQPGDGFGLTALRLPARARLEPSAFTTLSLEGGFEHLWGSSSTAAGGFAHVGFEVRPSAQRTLRLGVGLHTLRPGFEKLRASAELEHKGETLVLRPRLERAPRLDSFRAFAGNDTGGDAVSDNVLSVHAEHRTRAWRAWVAPQLSLVTGPGVDANLQLGLGGGAEMGVFASGPWSVSAGYDTQGAHYGRDAATLGGAGYYSPSLHWVNTPRVTVRREVARSSFFELSGGPSLQYQVEHGTAGRWLPGGQGRLVSSVRLADDLAWETGASLIRMGDAYLRVEGGTSLHYVF